VELQRGTEGVSEGSCPVRPETVAKQQEEALSQMLAVMVKQHANGHHQHAVLVVLVFSGRSVDMRRAGARP
jgi:hypothetical protein